MNAFVFALLFAIVPVPPVPTPPVKSTTPPAVQQQDDGPNVLVPDPFYWMEPGYVEPYKFQFEFDLGLPKPEPEQHFKKLPWRPQNIPEHNNWVV